MLMAMEGGGSFGDAHITPNIAPDSRARQGDRLGLKIATGMSPKAEPSGRYFVTVTVILLDSTIA